MATFGGIPAGTHPFEAGLSDDKRALTLTFATVAAQVGRSTAPVGSVTFSVLLPVVEAEGKVRIRLTAEGSLAVPEGGTATALFTVNGVSAVDDVVGDPDRNGFELPLSLVTDSPSECRVTLVLVVGRDSSDADSEAFANLLSIDAEILD